MQDTLKLDDKTTLSRHKLVSLVSELFHDYSALTPDPEDPNPPDPPWPWRHLINKAFDRMLVSTSLHGTLASLNPQPLPPRFHFSIALAREVVERAVMMQEIADGINENGEKRGIIIVSGYINRFVDDLCPDPPIIKLPKRKWPFPPDPDPRWTGLELAVIGTHFLREAMLTGNKGLQKALNKAGEKIMDTAVSR